MTCPRVGSSTTCVPEQQRSSEEPALDFGTLGASLAAPADAFSAETAAERLSRDANAHFATAATNGLQPPQRPFRVLGMTEAQALRYSGDKAQILYGTGSVFTPEHIHGDMANRWSHASVVKIASGSLEALGVPQPIAALAGGAVFLPKEMFYDKHFSPSDLVIADYELYRSPSTTVSVSGFADGSLFGEFQRSF